MNTLKGKLLFFSLPVVAFACLFTVHQVTKAAQGDAFLVSQQTQVGPNQEVAIEFHVDTGALTLGSYQLDINFDANLLSIDTTKGVSGIETGVNGNSFYTRGNPNLNGVYRFSGFDAESGANGSDVHLATIHFLTSPTFASGQTTIAIDGATLDLNDINFSDFPQTQATTGVTLSASSQDPTVPLNVQAVPLTPDSATISWTASTDDGTVTGYKIFRDTVEITTVADTSYVDTGLVMDTDYTYTVQAVDDQNNLSPMSDPVMLKIHVYGLQDAQAVINAWGTGDSSADFKADGVVNTQDLGLIMHWWGGFGI